MIMPKANPEPNKSKQ